MKNVIKTMLGIGFILIGAAIYLYPNYREWELQKTIPQVKAHSQTADKENEKKELTGTEGQKQSDNTEKLFLSREKSEELYEEMARYNLGLITGEQEIQDAWDFKQTPVDLSGLISEDKAIGSIELPDIDLILPLFIGASEVNMSKGAVVLSGTSMPIGGGSTNCVIAAHRGWSGSPYFRDIDQLKVGSMVKISNPWEILLYQVTGTEIVHATENEILKIQPGKDMVTLFSCYPYGHVGTKYRQVIFCERLTDENHLQGEGTGIREMTDQIVEEKGIVIEEDITGILAQHEDMLRVILPITCVCLALLLTFIRRI